MSLAASFLGGARGRLLPASIPFRFFGMAVVFHVGLWIALLLSAGDAAGFAGGLGIPLAAIHMLTLGVLTSAAMGAAFQLLPVATRQPLRAVWPTRLAFWLFLPGVLALGHGMATGHQTILVAGGVAAAAGLMLFATLLADNLARARDLPMVAAHGWLALASLVALVGLGLLLITDFGAGILDDHLAVARAHAILAGYGFMGMLVLGFSQVLVPMFGLSQAPSKPWSRAALILSGAALAVAGTGAVLDLTRVTLVGAALGLGAVGAHLWTMVSVLKTRMRRNLGLSFVLVRAGWVLLPVSIIAGVLDLLDLAGPRGSTLFGFLLLFGWLLTFLMGIMQRILPFLASMHAAKVSGKAPLVSKLSAGAPLRVHAICHGVALLLLAGGILLDSGLAIALGAAVGLAGALAFAWFAWQLLRRVIGGGKKAIADG